MTGWWRKNAVGLAAVVVLLPVTFGAIAWQEWGGYYSFRPSQPVVVEPGDNLEFADAMFGPATARFYDDPDAPAGSRVVRVRIPVEPGETELQCSPPLLREATGAQRQWDEASSALGRGLDDDRTLCYSDSSEPFEFVLEYLVPSDSTGPFYADVELSGEIPRFVRLTLEPEGL